MMLQELSSCQKNCWKLIVHGSWQARMGNAIIILKESFCVIPFAGGIRVHILVICLQIAKCPMDCNSLNLTVTTKTTINNNQEFDAFQICIHLQKRSLLVHSIVLFFWTFAVKNLPPFDLLCQYWTRWYSQQMYQVDFWSWICTNFAMQWRLYLFMVWSSSTFVFWLAMLNCETYLFIQKNSRIDEWKRKRDIKLGAAESLKLKKP